MDLYDANFYEGVMVSEEFLQVRRVDVYDVLHWEMVINT